MDITRNLKDMTFHQVLCSNSAYKKQAIQMLIDALNDDTAYNVLTYKETEAESKLYRRRTSL